MDGQPQRHRDVTTAGSGQTLGSTVLRNFLESFQLFVAVVLAAHMTHTFSPTFRTFIFTCAWGMSRSLS
jgi:uncharacterized MAPEG superfamily protein